MSTALQAFKHESTVSLNAPITMRGSTQTLVEVTFTGRKYLDFHGGDLRLSIDNIPGYWSTETIRVTWDRADANSEPQIGYSSGGYARDFSDIERACNFSAAMAYAASIAQSWVLDGWEKVFDAGYANFESNEKVTPQ